MRVQKRTEKWVGTDGSCYSVTLDEKGVSCWVGEQNKPCTLWFGDATVTHWPTALAMGREKHRGIYPGTATKLAKRRYSWEHVAPDNGEVWYQDVAWEEKGEGDMPQPVAWAVRLERWCETGSASYEQDGYALTWDGGIEKGRLMLATLSAIPLST